MKINIRDVKTVLLNSKIPGTAIEQNTELTRSAVSLYRVGKQTFDNLKLKNAVSIQKWIDKDEKLQSFLKLISSEELFEEGLIESIDTELLEKIIQNEKNPLYSNAKISKNTKFLFSDLKFIRSGEREFYNYPIKKFCSLQNWVENQQQLKKEQKKLIPEENKPFSINYKKTKDLNIFAFIDNELLTFSDKGWGGVSEKRLNHIWSAIERKGITYRTKEEVAGIAKQVSNGEELLTIFKQKDVK